MAAGGALRSELIGTAVGSHTHQGAGVKRELARPAHVQKVKARTGRTSQPTTRTMNRYNRRTTRTAIVPQPSGYAKSQARDPVPSSEAVQAARSWNSSSARNVPGISTDR
jgi:hypothetical protein